MPALSRMTLRMALALALALAPCAPWARAGAVARAEPPPQAPQAPQDAPAAPPADSALEAISRERLLPHVLALTARELDGRRSGTSGAAKAADYMQRAFEEIGLDPEGTMGYRQPFRRGGKDLANVVARLDGSDSRRRREFVVVGAHFDHLGEKGDTYFPGADDNASGCAVLIEVARALKQGGAPARSVLFIGFDGEETGLLGSRHFVKEPTVPKKALAAMLNLDMVSRGAVRELRVCGTPHSAELKRIVEEAAPRAGLDLFYDHEREWRHLSDHGPFGDEGIPFLYFGVLDHEDYHRPSDVADKVDGDKLERIARLAYLTVRGTADLDKRPRFAK